MLHVRMETTPAQGRQRASCWAQDAWMATLYYTKFTCGCWLNLCSQVRHKTHTQTHTHRKMHRFWESRGIYFQDGVRIYWLFRRSRGKVPYARMCIPDLTRQKCIPIYSDSSGRAVQEVFTAGTQRVQGCAASSWQLQSRSAFSSCSVLRRFGRGGEQSTGHSYNIYSYEVLLRGLSSPASAGQHLDRYLYHMLTPE